MSKKIKYCRYKHIKGNTIVKATRYKAGVEDGFANFDGEEKPYVVGIEGGTLYKLAVSENDFVIKFNKDNKQYTFVLEDKIFKSFYRIVK